MAEIKLYSGSIVLIDDEDYQKLFSYKWVELKDLNTSYARVSRSSASKACVLMHRLILGIQDKPTSIKVDHINHNGLDNRKENLRICNHSENLSNMITPKSNCSGFRGVYFDNDSSKWAYSVVKNYKQYRSRTFDSAEEAFEARMIKAKELHGEFVNA